jgi:hypothetical protein
VEQFIFASFKWEYETGRDVLKQYWEKLLPENDDDVNADKDEKVHIDFTVDKYGRRFVGARKGSDTRWWMIGEAATILWDALLAMRLCLAEMFDKLKKSGKVRETCQTFLLLARLPEIICDLALVKCYHHFFVARHLKSYQDADLLSRKAGFQAFSIFIWIFLMQQDYERMISDYAAISEFADLTKALAKLPEDSDGRQMAEKKIAGFFWSDLMNTQKRFDNGYQWKKADWPSLVLSVNSQLPDW